MNLFKALPIQVLLILMMTLSTTKAGPVTVSFDEPPDPSGSEGQDTKLLANVTGGLTRFFGIGNQGPGYEQFDSGTNKIDVNLIDVLATAYTGGLTDARVFELMESSSPSSPVSDVVIWTFNKNSRNIHLSFKSDPGAAAGVDPGTIYGKQVEGTDVNIPLPSRQNYPGLGLTIPAFGKNSLGQTITSLNVTATSDIEVAVPEPSSIVLAGTAALAGLGLWARRRRAG